MPFGSLWLPVVVSAVVIWVASAVAHMVLKHHKADYRGLPDEESVRAAMRKSPPAPGYYITPHCTDMSQLKDPAVIKRYEEGPVALIAVLPPGPPTMGKNLVQWFVFCFLVSFVAAYVARHTLLPGMDGLLVCRITATVAFAGYGLGLIQDSIWKAVPWSNTARGMIDALVYAVLTGLIFMFLWPGA